MRAILTVTVDYDSATTDTRYIREQLDFCANHLANEGLLSGESEAVVDGWSHKIEVKSQR